MHSDCRATTQVQGSSKPSLTPTIPNLARFHPNHRYPGCQWVILTVTRRWTSLKPAARKSSSESSGEESDKVRRMQAPSQGSFRFLAAPSQNLSPGHGGFAKLAVLILGSS